MASFDLQGGHPSLGCNELDKNCSCSLHEQVNDTYIRFQGGVTKSAEGI